jgi:murein L,D-transpeptidase YcbB/YkuD
MSHKILIRVFAAGLMAGVALPALAQTARIPVVEQAPLADLTDPGIESPLGPVQDDGRYAEQSGPVVNPVAAVIADRIDAVSALPRDFVAKRRDAAVESFYDSRAYMPAWTDGAGATPKARVVLDRLLTADADGLDPEALGVPLLPERLDPAELGAFDLALSRAVIAYAEEASGGRVDPSKISAKNITRKPQRVDPIEALTAVVTGGDVREELERFNPPHEGFRQLKAKLAEVRSRPAEPLPDPIPEGATLKPGASDPRVVALRARLDLPQEPDPLLAEVYDEALVAEVKRFQSAGGLLADGIIGPRTLAVLNGVDRDEAGQIIANMEMWRWMPRKFGTDYIFVNIPEFMVRVVRHGAVTHAARVVVGTPANQTPVFSDEMEYLVVNPYWHVPESIRMKEMLPEIQADPSGYFQRHGYEAVWNGQVIDPATVVWDEVAIKYVAIRQPPSEANALGRIKFMFPNKHAVYLHDTPSRKLFNRDYRAYSHGCVRVDEPLAFAEAILEGEPDITVDRLESLFGGQEQQLNLTQHIPVHIGYFNAWVDENGVLQLRDDLYGHTDRVKKALEALATVTQ